MRSHLLVPILSVLCSIRAFGQTISTLAGQPVPLVNGPALGQFIDSSLPRVATDAAGNVYITVSNTGQIVRVNPATGALAIVAGTGERGFSGDGGPAVNAQLGYMDGIAVDAAGNLYVVESSIQRVRRISTSGMISTVAGNGSYGFSGDGGSATAAQMRSPTGVAVDASGNLYISDTVNHRIRKVNPAGIISTIAGTGTQGFGGDGGAATAASLNFPRGVAVGPSGSVCFSDGNNYRIRCVSSAGIITTVAGTGTFGYTGDNGPATAARISFSYTVAFDSQSNLYIADSSQSVIRKVNSSGTISTIAGPGTNGVLGDGGPAGSAWIRNPSGVAPDVAGNLWIADANYLVRRINASGIISTIGGKLRFDGDGANSFNSLLNTPEGITRNANGNIYVADRLNNRVRRIDANGIITTFAGTGLAASNGDGGPAVSAALNDPSGVFADPAGNVYITEWAGQRVRRVNPSGVISTVAGTGAFGSTGDGGPATSALLSSPSHVVLDAAGNLYISEQNGHRIRRVGTNGVISRFAGIGVEGFSGDGAAANAAQLNRPRGLAVDAQGNLYIADEYNHRIRRVTTSGIISTVVGTGTASFRGDGGAAALAQISYPSGLAVDGSGNLWIADASNGRARFVSAATGIIATAVGGGGTSSDGVAALSAAINPIAITSVSDGRILIVDAANHRIRQVGIGNPVIVTFQANPSGYIALDGGGYYVAPVVGVWTPGTSHSFATFTPLSTAVNERLAFANWSDGDTTTARTITVANTNPTYTANFIRQFFLTGQVSPTGSGTVTSNWFNAGSLATVQAAPNAGYQFANFTGALSGPANPQPLLIDSPKTVTANFTFAGTPGGRRFIAVTPCRLADTRNSTFLAANTSRNFVIPQLGCAGVPANAAAYSLNVTVVPKEPLGFLTIFPTGTAQPFVSTLNSLDGRIKANAAIVSAGAGGAVSVFVNNATDVILDINGYFVDPAVNGNGLAFYPITPCRVSDTRNASGSLGGPIIPAGGSRDIPVRSSACGVPPTAVAYSVNATVVPPAALGFLSLWPTGQPQPVVSTLNAPTGAVTANAAIVPAGTNGAITAFMSSASHLVLDINGYFAPAGSANAQSFFPVAPCRLLDTRNAAGEFGGPVLAASAARGYRLPLASCGLPATAAAFSVNATVVPTASLGFLTLWPTGQTQPFVSTLNAIDGSITANAAIVPAGTAGAVSSYVTGESHLILDTNGYFAP